MNKQSTEKKTPEYHLRQDLLDNIPIAGDKIAHESTVDTCFRIAIDFANQEKASLLQEVEALKTELKEKLVIQRDAVFELMSDKESTEGFRERCKTAWTFITNFKRELSVFDELISKHKK